MSDDRPTAVALPGPPESWLASLRTLLRDVRGKSPSEDDVRAWLEEHTEGDTDANVDRYLDFLAAIDVLDGGDTPPSLGPYGRDFLDSHDEGVLFETLAANVAGVRALVEVLAIRPITDIEAAELLSRELDAEIEDASAYRGWLRALGYAEYDEGVIDLTTKGRRLVDSDAELSDGAASRLPSTRASEAADAAANESDDEPTAGEEATPGTAASSSETTETARSTAETNPPDMDASTLTARHDYRCMVCGDRRRQAPEEGYAEVHYLMPPDEDHGGPTDADNAVVVCPNHRADFEHGLIRVDPQSLTVEHAYETDVSGRTLRTVEGHALGAQYLAYHNDVVADF
ncbi:hypothetical protein HWV23_10160 [Natronomonas halophila]|uniref:hypothetical protein n=1 Tax=Natronomonas halophila TaxID=2747817 RepID=UPI0015B46DDC|nr:hypothetical protein [Natronomonas halophila]QLD86075.1 hypothetical protein HWV23_10160 [Natronomonas halophila]